jgi:hypothetical protein
MTIWKRKAKQLRKRNHDLAETISTLLLRQVNPAYLPKTSREYGQELIQIRGLLHQIMAVQQWDDYHYEHDILICRYCGRLTPSTLSSDRKSTVPINVEIHSPDCPYVQAKIMLNPNDRIND